MASEPIRVQVIHAAGPGSAWTADLALASGATVADAIEASGFLRQFPDYDPQALETGIFGQSCPATRVLADGDRVEIYRALDFDPMESRRRRAAHRKNRLSRT